MKRSSAGNNSTNENEISKESEELGLVETGSIVPYEIKPELLNVDDYPDENCLIEITDKKILAQIDGLIPGLAQIGNAMSNVANSTKASGEVLYRAIIPAGAELTKSRSMEGAVRGIYHGADGIKGHANLVAAEAAGSVSNVANVATAAMGVASMIVGQYYMTQINNQLGVISDSISKVSEFQDDEYRSRVGSLISHVKAIADFRVEIIENDELRKSKIDQLERLSQDCTDLLGQANIKLARYSENEGLKYDDYEKELQEAHAWYKYQKSLFEVLCKIADLKYALNLGTVSKKQCVSVLDDYEQQVEQSQNMLIEWHRKTIEKLNIDPERARRERTGLDRLFHSIPSLFDDKYSDAIYRPIDQNTADMIMIQANVNICDSQNVYDYYDEDVELISKGGKIYYLPKGMDNDT